ncbi:MAG: efflux RND transporter periplasmic adaptor subunit [Bacteroidales bacterium]
MKKTKILVWIMLVAGIMSACNPEESKDNKQDKQETKPVKITELRVDSIERQLSYTANLDPWEVVNYAPATPGRIKKIYVDEGDRISKGQKLVQMDQTELTQALINLDNARRNFQRMDTLNDLNSISKQQYDQAKTQYELAQANIEFLQENISLDAPFSGLVTAKYFEDGEMYSGSPTTPGGKSAVVTLMQISPIKVMVSLSERHFPYLKEGMKTTIKSDIYRKREFTGKISRIHPTIDPATRTFQAEIKINNEEESLRPGMFVTVNINIKSETSMLAPAIAVVKQEGTNNRHVFVAENGKARRIEVKLGDRFNDQLEILSDELKEGMKLIIAGQANLKHGDEIKVQNNN